MSNFLFLFLKKWLDYDWRYLMWGLLSHAGNETPTPVIVSASLQPLIHIDQYVGMSCVSLCSTHTVCPLLSKSTNTKVAPVNTVSGPGQVSQPAVTAGCLLLPRLTAKPQTGRRKNTHCVQCRDTSQMSRMCSLKAELSCRPGVMTDRCWELPTEVTSQDFWGAADRS